MPEEDDSMGEVVDITAKEIRPYSDLSNDEFVTHIEHNEYDPDKILDVLATLYSNGVTNREQLVTFGKRMATLMWRGGLTPSEAKARTVEDLFPQKSRRDSGDLLGMSKGGFQSLARKAASKTGDAENLHFMTWLGAMNLVLNNTIAAESPADYETQYTLLERLNPRTEWEEHDHYSRGRPDTQMVPPEPQYCLIEQVYAPPGEFNPDDPPEERTFSPFQDLEVVWFMDDEEVVNYLYEEEFFWTVDRAELWKEMLETRGFTLQSDPPERLHPDAQEEW